MRRYLERALAIAHAALDEPTPHRVADAHATGHDALALAAGRRPGPTTLADGHILYALASQLRGLLAVLPSPALAAREHVSRV
ncbi:MAG: hypothetical protein ACXVAN_10330 [Polyangia bacterium]